MNFRRLLVVSGVAVVLLSIFGSAIFHSRSFVFRDAGHYYLPLFDYTRGQWRQGVPLWNSRENGGQPLAADATASVFYPAKLAFLLPCTTETCFKGYIIGHVCLAAIGAWLLARNWKASEYGAGVAAVSYAFSGSVLFQYCNVIFLVSAAWLPFAMFAADRMLRRRSVFWAMCFAASLALMTLGGDPQMSYHGGLLAAIYAVVVWRSPQDGSTVSDVSQLRTLVQRFLQHRVVLLAIAAMMAFALCAVQVLPSMTLTRHSERAAFKSPRSIYEAAQAPGNAADGLLYSPEPGTHHDHVFQFSVGPWRYVELVWPNISGRAFPTNTRWMNAIPAEGRIWSPTLYMGLFPFLLAAGACSLRRSADPHVRFLTVATLLSTLAALGWYGAGWLLQEFRLAIGGDGAPLIGEPVGGLYWFMTVVLPGYVYFRFPAKLLTIASLAMSILAARGWDQTMIAGSDGRADANRAGRSRLPFVLLAIAVVTLVGMIGMSAAWRSISNAAPGDSLFGPFDATRALRNLWVCGAHTIVLCLAGAWLFSRRDRRWLQWLAFSLIVVDLAIAQHSIAPTAPTEIWREPSIATTEFRNIAGDGAPVRVYRGTISGWEPAAWSTSIDPKRQQIALAWDKDTLFPKHHLMHDASLVEAYGSVVSHDRRQFIATARSRGPAVPGIGREPAPEALAVLGADFLVLPEGAEFPGAENLANTSGTSPQATRLFRFPSALPRAWIVHRAEVLSPLDSREWSVIEQRTESVLFPAAGRDFSQEVVLETDEVVEARSAIGPESCRVVFDEPGRVEIDVQLTAPGVVVFSDSYAQGWRLKVTTASGDGATRTYDREILRANRIMRGVPLPAGKHRLAFRYTPWEIQYGFAISGVAWLIFSGLLTFQAFRKIARPN